MPIHNVTLNPSDSAPIIKFYDGNLRIYSNTTGSGGVRATHGRSTGKWYFEVVINAADAHVGVANRSQPLTSLSPTATEARAYVSGNGNKIPSNLSYGQATPVGGTISVLLNMDVGSLEFWINGTHQGIAFTDLKNLGEVYPYIHFAGNSRDVTVNFGATPFVHPVPKGYNAYNNEVQNKFLILTENNALIKQDQHSMITASASSTVNANFPPESAVNGKIGISPGERWASSLSDENPWFRVDFPYSITINKIRLLQFGNNRTYSRIKDCRISFSNETSLKVSLDDRSAASGQLISDSDWNVIEFDKVKTSFVKLEVLNRYSATYNYASFIEFEVYHNDKQIKGEIQSLTLVNPPITEETFVKHGAGKSSELNLHATNKLKKFIVQSGEELGSGKVFKQRINPVETPIKGTSID